MDIIEFYKGLISFIKFVFEIAPYMTVILLLIFVYMTISKKVFESLAGVFLLHSAMFFMMITAIDLMYFN